MKILRTMFLMIAVYAVILTTVACDQNQIRKAAKASDSLSGLTLDAVRATKQAFESGAISLSQKDALADKLLILARGGQTFNAAVKQLSVSGADGMTPDKWQTIERLFDAQVITPFLAFLAQTTGINNSANLSAAIKLIRISVLTIARVFGGNQAITERINRETNQFAAIRFARNKEMIYV